MCSGSEAGSHLRLLRAHNLLAVAGVQHLPEDVGPLRALEVVLFDVYHRVETRISPTIL